MGFPDGTPLSLMQHADGSTSIEASNPEDNNSFVSQLLANGGGEFIAAVPAPVDKRLMSRFIAKMAIEVLAQSSCAIEGWHDEVIFKRELDDLRRYARYGDPNKD